MNKKLVIAAFVAALPLASAEAMNVADFLQKATALEKKGMMALFSSDMKLLKKEVETAAGELRAERLAAPQAGKKAAFCPPQKGASLNSGELLAHLRGIPAPQRAGMQVKDGLRSLMARKYPCRG